MKCIAIVCLLWLWMKDVLYCVALDEGCVVLCSFHIFLNELTLNSEILLNSPYCTLQLKIFSSTRLLPVTSVGRSTLQRTRYHGWYWYLSDNVTAVCIMIDRLQKWVKCNFPSPLIGIHGQPHWRLGVSGFTWFGKVRLPKCGNCSVPCIFSLLRYEMWYYSPDGNL